MDDIVSGFPEEPADPPANADDGSPPRPDGEDSGRVTYRTTTAVAVLSNVESPEAESIHTLRTHLAATHVREGKRGLAVCASDEDADLGFIAVNLAVSFARAGLRTLLIDADLRNPAVHRLIVPSKELMGLRQCLENAALQLGDAIQENVLNNFSVIYAGGHADNAQELLASQRFQQIVDLCLRDFDMTVITTPPSNTCADARRIASVVHYAIIVARKDKTFLADVNVLISELQSDGARVIGSVFNAA